jgi:Mrp family chromosome partitioning ATPase
MSRNFELLQKLEEEQRPQTGAVPISRSIAAASISSSLAEAGLQTQPGFQSPDEVCKLVRRLFLVDVSAPRVLVFSSVERGAGCTWMAAHCAQLLATQIKGSVCLVDANLPFPALHSFFGVDNSRGFAQALLHSQLLAKCATQLTPRNLWLLPSGRAPAHDAIVDIDSLRGSMRQLREQFDYAIIDAPPWDLHSHAAVLGSAADGIVLVLKANCSRRGATQKVVAEMKADNIRLLGAVLNQRTFPIPRAIYERL